MARTIRTTIPDAITEFVIPDGVRWIYLKNVSLLNSIRINFEGDGASNYLTIAAGGDFPQAMDVRPGQKMYTDGVGGSATAEILMWD